MHASKEIVITIHIIFVHALSCFRCYGSFNGKDSKRLHNMHHLSCGMNSTNYKEMCGFHCQRLEHSLLWLMVKIAHSFRFSKCAIVSLSILKILMRSKQFAKILLAK